MDYDLAKELEDAGFETYKIRRFKPGESFSVTTPTVPDPNLEDLIIACGDDFLSLDCTSNGWRALPMVAGSAIGSGLTPRDAVARLWLALNKI